MVLSSASAVPVVSIVSSVDAGRIINTWRHLVVTAESGKEEGKSTVNAYHQV